MKLDGHIVEGDAVGGQASLSSTGDSLHLFLTEEMASADVPPYELSALLADYLEIEDAGHRTLLHTALISSDPESMYSTFVEQGLEVDDMVFGKHLRVMYHSSSFEV